MKKLFVCALLSLAAAYVPANSKAIPDAVMIGEAVQTQLNNGLKVVVIPDHRSPVAVQMLWYKAGGMDEPKGKTGIAHMLEHMMFRGTKDVPAGVFSEEIAKLGGQHNAFTNSNATIYFQKVARQHLPKVMELEADRMVNLVLSDALFMPERDVVREERHLRTDNRPDRLFAEQLERRHYTVAPYGQPVLGWLPDINAYTPQDGRDWYNNYYAPNNAVLVLAGDISPQDGLALANKYYGNIKPKAVLRPPIPVEPMRYDARRMTTHNPEAAAALLVRHYRTPGRFEGIAGGEVNQKDVTALMVLGRILAHDATGLLHQLFVVDKKLSDGVSLGYDPVVRAEPSMAIAITPKPDVSVEAIEKTLDAFMGQLLTNGVDNLTMQRAIKRLKFDYVMLKDDVYLHAYHMGRWVLYGGTATTLEAWQKDLDILTVDDILRVARTYLRLENSTTGLLINKKATDSPQGSPPQQPKKQREGGL